MRRICIEPPELEKRIGMMVYVTASPPVRARLRERLEDFVVEEIPHPSLSLGGEGRYAIYVLEKRGVDTFKALRMVARLLGVSWRLIGYAGMKDKNAVTRQYISVPAGLLKEVPERISVGKISLILAGFSERRIGRGFLHGNRFRVVLRHAPGESGRLVNALEELGRLGVIPGFYGHQRFGTRRPNTHIVGKLLARRDWWGAVAEIAGNPYPAEAPESLEARRLFDEGKLEEALAKYPRSLRYERALVKRLVQGDGPLEALRSLPRSLLELYLSAYQSYLFNLILSRRIVETDYDLKRPVEGETVAALRPGYCPHNIPVPGVGLENLLSRRTRLGEIAWRVLEEEGVRVEDFRIPELRLRGRAHLRPVCCFLEEYSFTVGAGETVVEFKLAPGMYASVALREVVKGDPLETNY